MRKILFFLVLFCMLKALHAQHPYIYTIKADSVKITNTCDTAELIIENHTQNVPGFLFNKGRGRTEFRRPLEKLSDSLYLVGLDSLKLPNAWLQNGNSFGTIGRFGTNDNNPVDFYSNNTFRGRLSTTGNLLWGTTVEDGRWKMEVESGSVGAIKAKYRLDVFSQSASQNASVVISNGNFGPFLTLGVAGGNWAWHTYTVPTDAVISTRPYHRMILASKVVLVPSNTVIGANTDDGNRLQVYGTGKFTDTLKLPNIISQSDTSGYKPIVADVSGNVFKMNYWPGGGGGSGQNFANADLSFTGNRVHNGAYQYLNLNDFGGISMKIKSHEGWPESELLLDTLEGFRLTMEDKTVPLPIKSKLNIFPDMLKFNLDDENQDLHSDLQLNQDKYKYKAKHGTNFSNINVFSDQFALGTSYGGASGGIGCSFQHDGYLLLNTGVTNAVMTLASKNSESGENFTMLFDHTDSVVLSHNESQYSNTRFVQFKDKFLFKNAHPGILLDFRLSGLPSSSSTADSMLVVDNNGQVKKRSQSPTRKSITVTGASYTVPVDVDVVFVNYTAGQATITLPTGTLDREITIKNLHTTNTVIISGLDTSESNSIATRGAITVKYTGSAWVGISKY